MQSQQELDNVFFTCCILHNILIEYNGYDSQWEDNIDWQNTHPDDEFDEEYDIFQLQNERAQERFVNESVDVNNLTIQDAMEVEVEPDFHSLRSKLITHFSQAKLKGEVTWL